MKRNFIIITVLLLTVSVFCQEYKIIDSKTNEEIELKAMVEQLGNYDAIIVAVSHDQFKEMGLDGVKALGKTNHVLYDIKYLFPSEGVDGRL